MCLINWHPSSVTIRLRNMCAASYRISSPPYPQIMLLRKPPHQLASVTSILRKMAAMAAIHQSMLSPPPLTPQVSLRAHHFPFPLASSSRFIQVPRGGHSLHTAATSSPNPPKLVRHVGHVACCCSQASMQSRWKAWQGRRRRHSLAAYSPKHTGHLRTQDEYEAGASPLCSNKCTRPIIPCLPLTVYPLALFSAALPWLPRESWWGRRLYAPRLGPLRQGECRPGMATGSGCGVRVRCQGEHC